MIEAILALIPGGWATAILAGIGALGVALWRAFAAGKKSAEGEQAVEDREAVKERLEMHRDATEAERKAAGMSDDEAKQEALKWAKR